jgi:hypothetical protein
LATCQSMRLSPTLLNASGQVLAEPSSATRACA